MHSVSAGRKEIYETVCTEGCVVARCLGVGVGGVGVEMVGGKGACAG